MCSRTLAAIMALVCMGVAARGDDEVDRPDNDMTEITRRLSEWRRSFSSLRIVWEEISLPPSDVPLVEAPPPAEAENIKPFVRTQWVWSEQGLDLLDSRQFFDAQDSQNVESEAHSIVAFNGPMGGLFRAQFRKSKNEEAEKFIQLDLIGIGDAKPTSATERTPLRGLYWPLTAQWLPERIVPESKWKLERIEDIAGEPCARLSSAPYLSEILWLDLNHGCLVRRYQMPGSNEYHAGWDFIVDEFQQLDGSIWFPKRGRFWIGAMTTGAAPAASKNQMFVVTEAAVNQAVDRMQFEPPIPDASTIVHGQESPFEEVLSAWRQQNPHFTGEPAATEKWWLRAASAMGGSRSLPYLLAGAVAVFLGAAFLLSRRRRPGRFWQCSMRDILLLVAVCGLLLGILMPRIHQTLHSKRLHDETQRRQAAAAELVAAVKANDVHRASQALEAGADPQTKLTSGPGSESLLCASIFNGNTEMIELLLAHGADIEEISGFASTPANAFRGPTRGGPPLFAAVGCDQPAEVRAKMIRVLMERGANPRVEHSGFTAMDLAVHSSDAQVGDLLREYGLPYGPREMAAFDRLDELKRTIQETPGILHERFRSSYAGQHPTLLAMALARGYREMASFLIDAGAPLDTVVYRGSTLLHQAVRGGDPELIRLLVARGLDVDATDGYSDTPLTDGAWQKPDVVVALLEAGADVNHRGTNGRTALFGAVQSECINTVQILLAAGADPTLPNDRCETPLELARKRGSAAAKLLQQAAEAAGERRN